MQYDNVIDVCIVPVAMYSRERLSIYTIPIKYHGWVKAPIVNIYCQLILTSIFSYVQCRILSSNFLAIYTYLTSQTG